MDKGDPSPSEENPYFIDSTEQKEDSNDTRDVGQNTKIMKPIGESEVEDIDVGLKKEGSEENEDEENQEEAQLADSKSFQKGETARCRVNGEKERTAGLLAHEDFETIKLYIKEESMDDDYNEDDAFWMIHESEEQGPSQPSTSQNTRNAAEMSGDKSHDLKGNFSEHHLSPAKLGSQFTSQEIKSCRLESIMGSYIDGTQDSEKYEDEQSLDNEEHVAQTDLGTHMDLSDKISGRSEYIQIKMEDYLLPGKLSEDNDMTKRTEGHGEYCFADCNDLSEGGNTDRGEKPFQCSLCDERFCQQSALLKHTKIHRGEKPFLCDVCSKRFTRRQNLSAHMRSHTGEKPYQCNVCDKRFSDSSSLSKHMKIHTGAKPFLCDVCRKRFTRRHHLVIHMRSHAGEKPYQCIVCDKRFTESGALSKHMTIHTGAKPYECNICSKGFTRPQHLSVHMRSHTGEKPYQCNVCDKRFSDSSSLSKHMKIHTGEKPFQCDVCIKRYTRRHHLVIHIRSHTGEKPYQCNVCDKRFSDSSSLSKHMKIHTGEKPFQCNVCSKNFRRPGHLTGHMRIHT